MFTLGFHIISIGILVVFVWALAYNAGKQAGERRLRRQLGLNGQEAPPAPEHSGH